MRHMRWIRGPCNGRASVKKVEQLSGRVRTCHFQTVRSALYFVGVYTRWYLREKKSHSKGVRVAVFLSCLKLLLTSNVSTNRCLVIGWKHSEHLQWSLSHML